MWFKKLRGRKNRLRGYIEINSHLDAQNQKLREQLESLRKHYIQLFRRHRDVLSILSDDAMSEDT